MPSPVPSIPKNVLWAVSGNAFYALTQWAVLVVLAKLGTPADVGAFALGLAISAPVMLFTSLQLRGIQATDSASDFRFRDYRDLRVAGVITGVILAIGGAALAGYSRGSLQVIAALTIAKGIESLSDVYLGLLQKHERMDLIARSLMLKGLGSVPAAHVGYVIGGTVAAASSLAVIWLGVLVFHDIPASRRYRPYVQESPSLVAVVRLLRLSLPLGFVGLLLSLQANLPRYTLERVCGAHELGVFAALASLPAAGATLVTALGQSASPRLAHLFRSDPAAFLKRLLRYAAVAASFALAGLAVSLTLGRPLLAAVFGAEYSDRTSLFSWLMATALLSYPGAILGFGMTAARRLRPQLPLAVAMAASVWGAAEWLVPTRGPEGAAWALALASLVQVATASSICIRASCPSTGPAHA
jgi:O-antigen/teichoic acid export membrane protein